MAVAGPKYSGWKRQADGDLELYVNGTLVATFTSTGVTWAVANNMGAAVTLNGVAYTFPAADGANTTQLTTNGSGVLAWLPADDGAA
jgi:hypothetical protein